MPLAAPQSKSARKIAPGKSTRPKSNAPSAVAAVPGSRDHGLDCPCGGGCPRCRTVTVGLIPVSAREAVRNSGEPLDAGTREVMEDRFGHDFGGVRVHTGGAAASSARRLSAAAYTIGDDIVFGAGRYQPGTTGGSRLLVHELAHVVQQSPGGSGSPAAEPEAGEAFAERAEAAFAAGGPVPEVGRVAGPVLQRKVEMRDVGRGEQSGFARLPELIDRLNAMSQGLIFSLNGHELTYEVKPGATLDNFDRQMQRFIDQEATIPVRLTNRHGLLGTPATGFHDQVDVDAWTSGYVDIDDLLASTDLGLKSVLVHFLRERSATRNYARRIGTDTFTEAEFQRVHGLGIGAEEDLLRDFFGDPTIRIVNDSPNPTVRRVFRNRRGDLIRRRVTIGHGAEQGVGAMSIDVVTRDGHVHTAEEYRQILEEERIRQQVERERLSGATEHWEGGRRVPAP